MKNIIFWTVGIFVAVVFWQVSPAGGQTISSSNDPATSPASSTASATTLPVRPGDISEYRQWQEYADKLVGILDSVSDATAASNYEEMIEIGSNVTVGGPRVYPSLFKRMKFIQDSEENIWKEPYASSPRVKIHGRYWQLFLIIDWCGAAAIPYLLDYSSVAAAKGDEEYDLAMDLFHEACAQHCNEVLYKHVPFGANGENIGKYRDLQIKDRLELAKRYQTAFVEILKERQATSNVASPANLNGTIAPTTTSSPAAIAKIVLPEKPTSDFPAWYNYIVELVEIVEKTPTDAIGSKRRRLISAINELGELQTSRAVPALVAKVSSVKIYDVNKERPDDFEKYPVMNALVKIGPPSLPFAADAIALADCKSMQGQLLLKVMEKILGDRQKVCEYLAARVELMKANINILENYLEYGEFWKPHAGVDPCELVRRKKLASRLTTQPTSQPTTQPAGSVEPKK